MDVSGKTKKKVYSRISGRDPQSCTCTQSPSHSGKVVDVLRTVPDSDSSHIIDIFRNQFIDKANGTNLPLTSHHYFLLKISTEYKGRQNRRSKTPSQKTFA